MPTRGNTPARQDDGVPTQGVSLTPRAEAAPHSTQVEQARARAQVEAAAFLAKQFPRSITEAIRQRDFLCGRKRMAETAFYRYSRGGSQISGPSIDLAKALAGVWGNIDYGLVEIERRPAQRTSTMMAYAWDLETNNRQSTTFEVPWVRKAGDTFVHLVDPRDIYENNANMGARRLREMILTILPSWFVDEAVDACYLTLQKGEEGVPITKRRAALVEAFGQRGVTQRQLEMKMGRSVDEMTPADLATLQVVYRALEHNETTVADEFPVQARDRLKVDQLAEGGQPRYPTDRPDAASGAVARARRQQQGQEPPEDAPPPDDAPPPEEWDRPITDAERAQEERLLPQPGTPEFDAIDPPRGKARRSGARTRQPDVGRILDALEHWDVPVGPEGEAKGLEVARRFLQAPELFALPDLTAEDAERLAEHVESMTPEEARDLGLPAT